MNQRGGVKLTVIGITGLVIIMVLASFVPFSPQARGQAYDYSGGSNQPLTITGLEGLQGFTTGQNQLSLATYMLSQDQGKSYFQVVGFAVSSPYSSQATVYSLKNPMMGVFDSPSSTMQIDMSQLAVSISGAGTVDKSNVYSVLRYDQNIFIIDMTLQFQGASGYQTIFAVTGMSMIAPDGTESVFTLQQPVQLVIDTMTYRMSFPVFPQFADAYNTYYSDYAAGYYANVMPIVYSEPIYVTPPVFVPVFEPIPIFVAPVFIQPFPVAGPFFINTFTPGIFCNQFAIASAAASAFDYGGNAFVAAQAVAASVSGGGGDAFAAAQAAASAGLGGGGIAVAAASAAAAASGVDVGSAANAMAAAVAGRGGASAAASAAAAAASGGADVGGVASAAAAAAAAATNGDPVGVTGRFADRLGTQGARQAFEAARQARQSGADPKTISGRIGDAVVRAGVGRPGPGAPGQGVTGGSAGPASQPGAITRRGPGVTAGGERPFTGISAPGQGQAGPGAGRNVPISEFPAVAGRGQPLTGQGPGQGAGHGQGINTGGGQPFSGITMPGQAGQHGATRNVPISQFPAVTGGGLPAGLPASPGGQQGITHRVSGGIPGQAGTGSPFSGGISTPAGGGIHAPQNIQTGGARRVSPGSAFQAPAAGGAPSGGSHFPSGGFSMPSSAGGSRTPSRSGLSLPSSGGHAPSGSAFHAPTGGGSSRITSGSSSPHISSVGSRSFSVPSGRVGHTRR